MPLNFGKLIARLRGEMGYSQEELADLANVSHSAIQKIEASNAPRMRQTTYSAIAKALNTSIEEIEAKWRNKQPTSIHRVLGHGIPIINNVKAGEPVDYTDVGKSNYDFCPLFPDAVGDPDAFAAVIVGDSMTPEWRAGDVAIFSPRTAFRNGMHCFVQFDGSADDANTFKVVVEVSRTPEETLLELRPLNARYRPRIVKASSVARIVPAVSKWIRHLYIEEV